MSRRRHVPRPYGHTVAPTRIISLIFAVGLLWLFYERARDPGMWRFLTGETAETSAAAEAKPAGKAEPPEHLARGENDRDPAEAAEMKRLLDLVTDKTPLRAPEMAAYWRLMNWSRVEPFRDLERRANSKVQFSQLWQQPERYRGKLVRLRLHVIQVIDYTPENADAARNGGAPPTVYEIRGATDDSGSNPLILVVPELPKGLKVGADVRGDVVFVGYFLKLLGYKAADENNRAAPLLIGRVRTASPTAAPVPAGPLPWLWLVLGTAAVIGLGLWSLLGGRRRARRSSLAAEPVEGLPLGVSPAGGPAGDDAFRFDFAPGQQPVIMPPESPRPDDAR